MSEEIEGEEQAQDSSTRASLDFAYGEAKDALHAQRSTMDALDAKAGLLLGAVAVFMPVMLGTLGEQRLAIIPAGLRVLSIAFMITAGLFALKAFGIKPYRIDPDPRQLWERYGATPEMDTKEQVLANLVQRFEENRDVLKERANSLRWAFRLVAIGVVLLGIATIYAILAGTGWEPLVNRIAQIWGCLKND